MLVEIPMMKPEHHMAVICTARQNGIHYVLFLSVNPSVFFYPPLYLKLPIFVCIII